MTDFFYLFFIEKTLDERRRTKRDTAIWTKWLRSYVDRLRFDWCDQLNQDSTLIDRAQRMNQVNPDFVLRNHVLQSAIEAAEHGDFSLVQKLVDIIQNPFDVTPEIRRKYSHFFKLKADKICVSCSS